MTISFNACSEKQTDYDKINSFLEKHQFEASRYKYIFVIDDDGCLKCNRYFSEYSSQLVHDSLVFFILSTDGSYFPLDEIEQCNNIIWDSDQAFKSMLSLKSSTFIKIDNNRIDTTIEINAYNLQEKIEYIGKIIN
ncbi:MAG: hypothetical protein JXR60_09975 [Bacteroidales bacterium]|nr:hypothetical protein [Bacteroidales bacterium]